MIKHDVKFENIEDELVDLQDVLKIAYKQKF